MAETPEAAPDFRSAFDEAGKTGYAGIEVGGERFTVVRPGLILSDGKSVFRGAEEYIPPPKLRAAYSDRTAWVMAALSELAYERFEDGPAIEGRLLMALAEGEFKDTKFFSAADGTQGFLTVRPGEMAVLVFRGTEQDRRDIMKDLDARFYNTPDGKAHRGFTRAFESVEANIRKALDDTVPKRDDTENRRPDMPFFITGHSLGAAIATAATQVLEEDYVVSACYTFGSPRIGTAEWSESVKSPVYRVVHGADGVPLVPLSGVAKTIILWIFDIPLLSMAKPYVEKFFKSGYAGYQHAGDMRFIVDGDPARLRGGSAAAWARFGHVVVGTLSRGLFAIGSMVGFKALSAFFADHSIKRYAAILRKIADQRNP